MAYSRDSRGSYRSDGRDSSSSRRSGRSSNSRQDRGRGYSNAGSYNRDRSSRPSRGRSSSRNGRRQGGRGSLNMPDTGYTLHNRRANFNSRGNTLSERLLSIDSRFLVLVVIVVIVLVYFVFAASSCVRGNSSNEETTEETQTTTTEETTASSTPTVAAGLDADLEAEFTEALERNQLLEEIAANADQYDDTRLLELALREPDAIEFVANYLTASASSQSYNDTVTRGTVPRLYTWDTRWGYVTYGDGCIGVTGSGLTVLSMAYMGLTGLSDQTPATIAQLATDKGTSENLSSDTGTYLATLASRMGLTGTVATTVSSDTITGNLTSSSVVAALVRDSTLTDDAHWVLVVGQDENGLLTVFDPTSTSVSSRTWAPSSIATSADSLVVLSITEDEIAALTSSDTSTDTSATDVATTDGTASTGSTTSDTDAYEDGAASTDAYSDEAYSDATTTDESNSYTGM